MEPGSIFKKRDGIKMTEEIIEEVTQEEEIFLTSIDADGNITKILII